MTDKKNKTIVIDPGPQITINNIAHIKDLFLETVKKNKDITLKTKSIVDMDLAGIQFIIFAKKFAQKSKLSLSIDLKADDTVEDLLINSGFNNLLST